MLWCILGIIRVIGMRWFNVGKIFSAGVILKDECRGKASMFVGSLITLPRNVLPSDVREEVSVRVACSLSDFIKAEILNAA